jgi:mono/diheme cytochrome c family protein
VQVIASVSRHPRAWTLGGALVLLCGFLALSGCGESYPTDMRYFVRTDPIVDATATSTPAHFQRPGEWAFLQPAFDKGGGKTLDPGKLTSAQHEAFETNLNKLFGSPAAPRVGVARQGDDHDANAGQISPEDEQTLKVDAATLAHGSALYLRHCLHCHGLTGDARGPTAVWVNPNPRDYRRGWFKFTSTDQSFKTRKPRREDLLRTLRQGIEGTSMPSFGLLPEADLEALASYVIHLSIRGQVELQTMTFVLKQKDTPASAIPLYLTGEDPEADGGLMEVVRLWVQAQSPSKLIKPGEYAVAGEEALKQSIERGHKLFMGQVQGSTGCISCHTDFGRRPNLKYDDWGTIARPADLTTGVYRGGRRPIDLYWRIYKGLSGTPMGASDTLKPDEIWDVVNFVQILPYPERLEKLAPEIHQEIYPRAKPAAKPSMHAQSE